jgi:DNA-binding MarR family transcriptional regulator
VATAYFTTGSQSMRFRRRSIPAGSVARRRNTSTGDLHRRRPLRQCIGIDDASAALYLETMGLSPTQAAQVFAELFGEIFLRFHRRGPKRSRWTPQGWAVLQHLEMAGPLTVTEAAKHMDRAQSVMSEIIDGLERKGLLARMRDARDRRRTLVWLTDEGRAAMANERQVLCPERLETAFANLPANVRDHLLVALQALVDASRDPPVRNRTPPRRKSWAKSNVKAARCPSKAASTASTAPTSMETCSPSKSASSAWCNGRLGRSPTSRLKRPSDRPWPTWARCPPGATIRK